MSSNILTVEFPNGKTRVQTLPLYQYDYGQKLKFEGLDLPDTYEVHFSNSKTSGEAYIEMGNADGVSIPDILFVSGEMVFAWIYLHAGEDDGETEYQVIIPIEKRAIPSDRQPTPVEKSAYRKAIDLVEDAVGRTEEAVEKAELAINHYPKIIDGYWYVWSADDEDFVNTNINASGEDGISPTITVDDIAGGHRITITDVAGTNTVDVMDGSKGDPGNPGATGNGIASIVKTSTSGLVDTYTISFSNNTTTTYTVTNGANGDDYVLTNQDKNDIANIVVAEIGSADTMQF